MTSNLRNAVFTGAMLTNLVTLLHNYVSHEFAEAKKPFCECLSVSVCLRADACLSVHVRAHKNKAVRECPSVFSVSVVHVHAHALECV